MVPQSAVPTLLAGILLLLCIGELRRSPFINVGGGGGGLAPLSAMHAQQLPPPPLSPSATPTAAVHYAPTPPQLFPLSGSGAAAGGGSVSVGLVKTALPLAEQAAALGALPLTRGSTAWTKCWFHSQIPHNQDRAIFAKLGGQYRDCAPAPARTQPQTNTESLLCDCVAPPDEAAYGQHFLEIGANDGVVLSNSLFFELQLGWEGLCIEASPVIFPLLQRNRPKCRNLNRLITPSARTETFFTLENKCGSWESMISCMLGSNSCPTREAALKMWDGMPGTVFHEDVVQGATLAAIFAELGWTSFGWIAIDVESAETVVFSTIDWSAVRARYVSHEGDNAEVAAMMAAAGYLPAEKLGHDSLFVPAAPPAADAASAAAADTVRRGLRALQQLTGQA